MISRQRLADRIAKPLVAIDEAAGKILAEHIQRQAFDQRLINRLCFAQRLLGCFVLAHQVREFFRRPRFQKLRHERNQIR